MPRNSSGTYTLPAGNPVVPNTLIETTWANPTLSDVASSLTDSLDRFGRGGMLAPLRFPDGTVTAPSVAFSSETTLGMFRPSAGTLALAVGGVSRFLLTASLLTITPPTTFSGLVTFNGGATIGGTVDIDELTNGTAQSFTTSSAITPDWQMVGTSAVSTTFAHARFVAGVAGPALYLGHSRGSTIGTHAALVSDDQFGQISFLGSDGSAFREGARIVAQADGAAGAASVPGMLVFLTSPDGTATPVEALRLGRGQNATFSANVSLTGALSAGASASVATSLTVGTTLDVAGATTLESTAVIGSSAAIPANTRVVIDRLGASVYPALAVGTTLTLAASQVSTNPAHLQFIAGNASTSTIFFGDTDAQFRGALSYSHSTDALTISTAGASALVITSGGDLQVSNSIQFPNGSAAAPSLAFTNSPTTGLFRQSADVIGFATAGAERWRINATGVLANTGGAANVQSTRIVTTSVTPILQASGDTLSTASAGLFMFESAGATSTGNLTFARSRSATVGNHTIVQNGDVAGRITVAGSDGTQFVELGRIQFNVDGAAGANDMPGRIEFYTTPDGGSAPGLALTLSNDKSATFAGTINGVNVNLTSTLSAPLTIEKTGSAINTTIGYTNTSGSVYAGHGPANAFAIGASSSLNGANWFNITSSLATFNGNVTVTGNIVGGGTARFNGATQGTLGVVESAGSGATVNSGADTLVLENSAGAGLSILTPNSSVGSIYFGDPDSANVGRIVYTHSTDSLTLSAGGVMALSITSSLITLSGGVDLILDNAGPTSTLTAGWRGIPQNSKSAAYTLVLADAGKHVYHPNSDATARTFTIPANSSVSFPIGTAVTFINDSSAGTITIAITTDTMVLAGAGTTGSRTLAASGIATAVKVASTRWIISGTNLS